ncbi:MAG TPA: RHS repeat-associated core domain-containing protein [Thermoanaerobaculia bacterium]|jgi:RHS repeat-associated protein|nr:RHS repeat-associated core domain-containing protein [Thermoanaerobaculia bacterium]
MKSGYLGLIALTVLTFLGTATARAACPVTLSLGTIDADGRLPATVTTNGNCGTSGVSVRVDGAEVGSQSCIGGPTCSHTFQIDTSCWGAAPRVIEGHGMCQQLQPNGSCLTQFGASGPQSKTVNNRPTVTLSMTPVDAFWRTTATVVAHFQTRATGRQYLRLVRNGNINDVVAQMHLLNPDQDVTWTPTIDLACQKGPQTFQAVAMTCGAHWGVIGGNPIPADSSLIQWSNPVVLQIEATPTATLTIPEPGPTGLTTATVSGHFPYRLDRKRYVRLFRNGNIYDVVAQQLPDDAVHDLTFQVPLNFACTSGTTRYQAAAMICGAHFLVIGGNPVPTDPDFIGYSAEVPMSDEADPDVSVTSSKDANGVHTGLITYKFPSTSTQSQRDLTIYIDNGPGTTVSMTAHEGTHTVALPACWKKLRVVATACDQFGNPAFTDEATTENPEPKPTVSLTLRKLGIDPATRRRIIEVTTKYNVQQPPGRVRIKLQQWKDADGYEHDSNTVIRDLNPPQSASGTDVFEYVPGSDAQQIGLIAIVDGCETVTDEAWISDCDKEGASRNPVNYNDGNMTLADTDPLPQIAGQSLTRTYNSDEQVVALFGRGWTTLFDRRLVADADVVSLSTATNEVVTFRLVGGVLVQTWPTAASAGTLVHDAVAGTYTWRAPGASETAVFRASDGRLLVLRDLTSGHEAQIGYDAAGLPQSFTDSRNGVSWTLTIAQGRVTSIGVSGRPDIAWTYSYDAAGNLTSVAASGGTWRSYEYATDRMTASRDALGNLIESHTYDANGYAVSSTGDVDEIALLEYGLPGAAAEELVTRVTYKTGATTEFALRPIGGAYRTVQSTGGCAVCGAGNATYVRDERGRVIREQGADGYVTLTVYAGEHVQSEERSLKPAGCDPQTDAQHCRLDTDALAIAVLEPTAATVSTTYEYADPLWPDRVTAAIRPSAAMPGQLRREDYVYHPVTGAVVSATVCGWSVGSPACSARTTLATFYEGGAAGLAPAFDPGGSFQSAWLSLPQPALLTKSVDGPRTDVQDVVSLVYYPIDSTVPALLRGRLAATRNPAGHITHYEGYDVFGNATREIDPNGVVTEMTFDALGRSATATTKAVAGCNTTVDPLCATDLTTTHTYSPASGPLQRQELAGGGVTSYTYDARGRVATVSRGPSATTLRERIETSYDPLTGKKSLDRTLGLEGGAWVEKSRQSFAYDTQARLQTLTHADGAAIHYTYDAEDRIATIRDENHAAPNTTYTYDPAGRVASVRQTLAGAPGGVITTHYTYDTAGNLISVTDPNGNVTNHVYDDFGQMTSQSSPVTGTATYEYDQAGNLTQTTDGNGASTERTYDATNRVVTAVSEREGNTETIQWTYDSATAGEYGLGRPATMEEATGLTEYSYERRGLLRREMRKFMDLPFVQTYGYDANGNRTTIGYPSGRIVTYAFDDAGRPVAATGTMTGQNTSYVTAASYLPFGPMTSLTLGNGTTETRTYNTRYLPLTSRLTSGATTVAQYAYTNDPAGNITAIADATHSGYNRTFGYDDLHRLTTANTGSALWGTGSFTYDRMGNMLSATLGTTNRTFTYQGTTPRINTATGLAGTMSYDAAGNELNSPAGDPGGAPVADYSPRNLLLSQFVGEYDRCEVENGSACVQADPVQEWRFNVYDGRGVRVLSTRTIISLSEIGFIEMDPPPDLFFYTPELTMLNIVSPTTGRTADVIWFGSRPVADHDKTTLRYTFTDHLGTPILQTTSAAAVVWRAEYEPFGKVHALRAGTIADDQPLRFPGQQVAYRTAAGEENYNIFRWYRSGWGRYTQADPIGLIGREYPYASNNPILHTDMLGLRDTGTLLQRPAIQTACRIGGRTAGWVAGRAFGLVSLIFNASDANPVEFEDQRGKCDQCVEKKINCDQLNYAVQVAKQFVGGLGACRAGMSRYELSLRRAAWLALATARARRDVKCWGGGNTGHQQAQADAWSHVGNCSRLLGM